jgi:uncharacterized protein YegL
MEKQTMTTNQYNDMHDTNNEFGIQVYQADINPAPRCACTLLLDISGSMSGAPIAELNEGVKRFFEEICKDDFARFSVETAVVTFGGGYDKVEVAMPFTSCAEVQGVDAPEFVAGGSTPLGKALDLGLNLLNKRKGEYKRQGVGYYQPWMVLLTDGAPTDSWKAVAQRVRNQCENRKLVLIPVGVGDEVDMNVLAQISPANRPPKRLQGLRFIEFFEWLSASMGAITRSSTNDNGVELPETDGWSVVM